MGSNHCNLSDRHSKINHQQLNDVIELKLHGLKNKQSEMFTRLKRLHKKNNLPTMRQVFLWLTLLGYMMIDKIL